MAIDIKDIQEAIQDGLKQKKTEILQEVKDGNVALESKVEGVLNDIKAQSIKDLEDVKKDINELGLKIQNKNEEKKSLSFKESIAQTILSQKDALVDGMRKGGLNLTMDLKDFNYTDFTGYGGFVTDYRNQPILNPYSSFHWRNVVPVGSTDKETIVYPKETATGGAADTWEHAAGSTVAKPSIEPTLSTYTSSVEWIAGLIKAIPVSMLEDISWLTSYISNKAMNELMKAEDLQIQSGSGVAPDLSGFFTGTNATAYNGSETKMFAKLIDAAYRQIADANYGVNKAVISNADKVGILLNTETGAGFNLPQGSVSVVNGQLNFAGLEVYSTSLMAAGTALVGDFNQSQFVVRSAPRLRFFEQNGTDAEKNQILARIEERAALAIFSSLAFVKIEPGT